MEAGRESDERLMRQVQSGHEDALGILLRRHATPLLTFIARMVGDRHRAEDLFQETFWAVWTFQKRYRYPQPFRPWLFGIAANKCRAELRRLPARPLRLANCLGAEPADGGPAPSQVVVVAETAAIVAEAVGRLPAGQRAVVAMRVWGGFSYSQIAEALGRSEATMRSHMFHALASLRKYLEPRMK